MSALDADQNELRAHWAKYVCVLASGFLENAIKEIYSEYAKSSSSPATFGFVRSSLNKIQNPKKEKFIEISRAFNTDWGSELEDFLDESGRGDAINSIISNRHLIAHGRDSQITLPRIKEYITKSASVIEFIENQCGVHS
ncbi:HEPN domain-containing protein [Nisaea sp.]|uniref:HEPN domain-containing protein n=1 Tax=Nisaea sp. TaxID=2024842 RepID=UPI003B52753F